MFSKITDSIQTFLGGNRGNVAVASGILAVPLMVSAGVAVDYSRISRLEAQMQQAADAAALAAASAPEETSNKELKKIARKFFKANSVDAEVSKSKRVRTRVKQTSVVVTANLDAELYLVHMLRKGSSKISVRAEATRSSKGVELALVVDNTASMGFGMTWENTVDAINLVLKEIKSKTVSGEFYTTLVPYTDRINIGTHRKSWLGGPGSLMFEEYAPGQTETEWESALAGWEGCVEPLEKPVAGYPWNLDMGAPVGSFVPTVEAYWSGVVEKKGPEKSECASQITGPTTNFKQITKAMDKLSPMKATGRFDDALAWGWRTVSEQYRGEWGAGADYPAKAGDRTKVVALFTDARTNINKHEMEEKKGEFGNNMGSKTLFSHLGQVCQRMKDEGITVFIFHMIGNEHATPYFEACAGENYFPIRNGPEFEEALAMLGEVHTSVRLVR